MPKSPVGVGEYRLLSPKLKAELPEASELKKLVANTGRFRVKTKNLKRTSAGKQWSSAFRPPSSDLRFESPAVACI